MLMKNAKYYSPAALRDRNIASIHEKCSIPIYFPYCLKRFSSSSIFFLHCFTIFSRFPLLYSLDHQGGGGFEDRWRVQRYETWCGKCVCLVNFSRSEVGWHVCNWKINMQYVLLRTNRINNILILPLSPPKHHTHHH